MKAVMESVAICFKHYPSKERPKGMQFPYTEAMRERRKEEREAREQNGT